MTQPSIRAGMRGGASGVGRDGARAAKMYGLVELDAAGTVLYTRFETDGARASDSAPDCTGHNFYTEVAPFRNVAEFKNMLDDFRRGPLPALSTDFTCDYEDGPVYVKVLLARIREHSGADSTKSVLVHMRRAQ